MTILDQWHRFLNGYWTRTQPQQAGTFPVKAVYGKDLVTGKVEAYEGFETAILFKDPQTGAFRTVPGHGWGGWWWSEPFPEEMPCTPDTRVPTKVLVTEDTDYE